MQIPPDSDKSPEKLNTYHKVETNTRFHIVTSFENNLIKTLISIGATHSYARSNVIGKINILSYKIFQPLSNKLIVSNSD